MKVPGSRLLLVVMPFVIAGCSSSSTDKAATSAAGATPAVQAEASHDTPQPPPTQMSGPGQTVQGRVLETFNASNYTYVRVKTDTGEVWAATLQFKVAVGDTVIVPLENPMRNFRSQALNRNFDLVYFASAITKPGEAPPASASASGLPPGHPATSSGAAAPPAGMGAPTPAAQTKLIDPVPPAPGGKTIADVWANRKSLVGKIVTVRGKVVKYNGGIMGLNWLHVQDGSGSIADGTHDLTITSAMESKVGDVVTVTGTVGIDKDFTLGYKYPVIIQGASIKK